MLPPSSSNLFWRILIPIRWSDGSKFVGAFQRGAQTGPGELTTLKGDVIKGSWLNGRGNGSMIVAMAGGDVFEGQFENGGLPLCHIDCRSSSL